MPCWEQTHARRAHSAHHVDVQLGPGAGHAGHLVVAGNDGRAVFYRHLRDIDLAGILAVYPHGRHRFHSPDQALLDGKGGYPRGDIATQAGVGDKGGVDIHLAEGIVYVGAGNAGGADDSQFAGQHLCTAQAVDLPGIRAAEDGQNDLVPNSGVLGQVVFMEENSLAGAAAVDGGADRGYFFPVHFQYHSLKRLWSGPAAPQPWWL